MTEILKDLLWICGIGELRLEVANVRPHAIFNLSLPDDFYPWEDTTAAVGTDYSGGKILVADERVEKAALARYCEAFEFGNPLYWDEEIAKRAGYRSRPARASAL